MIGLCFGLARKACKDTGRLWRPQWTWRTFGMVAREDWTPDDPPETTARYYELLDACPLRMTPGNGDG